MSERTDETPTNPWRPAGADPANPSAWRAGLDSPYRHGAFDILDLPIAPLPRRERQARLRRRVHRARAGQVRVADRPVEEAAVRTAEERLARPSTWLAERLLVHRPYPTRPAVEDLRARLAAIALPVTDEPPARLDRTALARLRDGGAERG